MKKISVFFFVIILFLASFSLSPSAKAEPNWATWPYDSSNYYVTCNYCFNTIKCNCSEYLVYTRCGWKCGNCHQFNMGYGDPGDGYRNYDHYMDHEGLVPLDPDDDTGRDRGPIDGPVPVDDSFFNNNEKTKFEESVDFYSLDESFGTAGTICISP